MRTMMKKSGAIAALTGALLVMALLVTGCQEPPLVVTGSEDPLVPIIGLDPVAGDVERGIVRLTLGNADARTIMPTHPVIKRYDLAFTSGTTTVRSILAADINATTGAATIDVSLAPGTYTLIVTGYAEYTDETDNIPVATASTAAGGGISPTSITIVSGPASGNPTITVEAKPLTTGNGTVSFTTDLTNFTATGATGTITLKTLGGTPLTTAQLGGVPNGPALIAGSATNAFSRTVAAGYYFVDVFGTTSSSGNFEFRDAVHVYPGMDSPATFTFTNRNLIFVAPGSATGGLTYLHPTDNNFGLMHQGDGTPDYGTGADDDPFRLTIGTSSTQYVQLTLPQTSVDVLDDSEYTWYLGFSGSGAILEQNTGFTVNTNAAPFNTPGTDRFITLYGLKGGLPYTVVIYISIES
jgi:hypothetical protein